MIAETEKTAIALRHDSAIAVDFLSRIIRQGIVTLAAISPVSKGMIYGRTFNLPEEIDQVREWIDDPRQADKNLYYTLNQPKLQAEQLGKAGRLGESDIVAIRGIVIDIDPRKDAESNREDWNASAPVCVK